MKIFSDTSGGAGGRAVIVVRAEVPLLRQPKIIKEIIQRGIRYYIGANRKKYIADRFDAVFKSQVSKPKHKHYKGGTLKTKNVII